MSKPTEHKTVQARILKYVQEIGWTYVPRKEAEKRRGFDPAGVTPEERARKGSPFFGDLLHAQVRAFNPKYKEAEGALVGEFQRMHADIYGNRDFLNVLRNQHKFFCVDDSRELDLIVIDYANQSRNVYGVTEEFYFHNSHFGNREDVVFLINGIPVLVIECKNCDKDEAIALGIDQIRRYHRETPELFVPEQVFTATESIGFSYGVTWNLVRRNIFEWKLKEGGFSNPPKNGGLESPPSRYVNPEAEIDVHEHRLPHWQQGAVYYFVTWRLADSLPQSKLREWHSERDAWLRTHPEPWDEATEAAYHERFSQRIDEWLDAGMGSCLLKDAAPAKIVADALRHFDGDRYHLDSFVVMPNHVHVLFRLEADNRLEDVVQSWKGFAAHEINKRPGRTGSLWQDDYWDRMIRNETHLAKCREYIRLNPKKGGAFSDAPLYFNQGINGGLESPPSLLGNLEAKVKSFCAIPHILSLIKNYIVFAEKDEELNKYILRQHQTAAVEKVVDRALDTKRLRGLVWHTQGSGKTFTMIKAAELLFKAQEAETPTILLMIDRNELEDQMLKNLAALGINNVEHANRIERLNQLLRQDYRGIIVTTIQKFRDMPEKINTRKNIYVFIDEAHRTTGGDLGNYLMAGLPNATYVGYTETPIDKTAYGKGTFKTFGLEDDKGYLHKYSIAESIEDGTTLPLFYALAQNELLVPHEMLEKEFLSLAEAEGVADIEELNKILERAINTKNFLKGHERVDKVAKYVAEHYKENVEPLGYKAFLVGVDREACAFYKKALDKYLPPEYSEVVYTGNNNDPALLKEFHLDPTKEKQIRKNFTKMGELPKILIVTEKLLTGFDAPILYAMYLDKPMRDHTLLQAIARVNRPYENEEQEMVKPHGFILDFVGIFDKLEKALAFDSDEINAVVKDIGLLKTLFQSKMEKAVPQYLKLIERNFDDKDVDSLIEHFRDKERRKEFFKEYKEIEMLYEIISPDAFLRPYLDNYATLSAIYAVVRKAYTDRVYVDRDFQKKTNELVQSRIDIAFISPVSEIFEVNTRTLDFIKGKGENDNTKIINLVKTIEKIADEGSDDPYLIMLAERARAVQERYEDRQATTQEALALLWVLIQERDARKEEQARMGLDGLTFFVYRTLLDAQVSNAENVSVKIKQAFVEYPNWRTSEKELREVRKKVTFAIYSAVDDMDKVAGLVEELFALLGKAYKI